MNKLIMGLVATVFLLGSVATVFAQDVETSVYVPEIAGTPPIIKAKWESPDSADPSHLIAGTQVAPPLHWDGKAPVEYCVVVTDINGKGNVLGAAVDVYHPDGTFKYEIPLTEVDTSTPSARQAAANKAQAAYNDGLVKFNTGYDITEVVNEILESSAKLYCGSADLDYHQMCGFYTVKSYAFDAQQGISPIFGNTFEYVCMAGIKLDFNSINFGEVVQSSNKWIEGDWNFVWQNDGPACNPDEGLMSNIPCTSNAECASGVCESGYCTLNCRPPTVKNIGNTPVYISVEFSDMGFGQDVSGNWNVEFDASLKHNAEVVFPPFVEKTLPNMGVEPEPYCEEKYGVLDLCDTEKISFSIHIKKVIDRNKPYTGTLWIEPISMAYPWWICG